MNPETAFIAFGSNQGNRQDFCDRTIALMELLPHSKVIRVSSYYETEPVDMEANPDDMWFYNGVIQIETNLRPENLLAICQETERSLGREPGDRNHSRTIDLDILFYGEHIINTSELEVPHPRLHKRRFVLAPMAELNPQWIHPQQHQTIQALLAQLTDTQQVRRLNLIPGSHYRAKPSCSQPPTN